MVSLHLYILISYLTASFVFVLPLLIIDHHMNPATTTIVAITKTTVMMITIIIAVEIPKNNRQH